MKDINIFKDNKNDKSDILKNNQSPKSQTKRERSSTLAHVTIERNKEDESIEDKMAIEKKQGVKWEHETYWELNFHSCMEWKNETFGSTIQKRYEKNLEKANN